MGRTQNEKNWTILSLIQWSESYLTEKGIDSPRLNAEQMLSAALGCKRIDLYTRFDKPLVKEELDKYKSLFLRRVNREPLQYILGYTEFYGRRFAVRPGVLIPRPETEHIIEITINMVRSGEIAEPRILDIGTGSGCIAVSLASELPGSSITAIDISKDALAIAQENAEHNSVNGKITFLEMDILTSSAAVPNAGSYHFVVTNPPYIPKGEWEELPAEIKEHEPRYALTDEADGLTYLKRISELAPSLLCENGWLLCEVGYTQSEDVRMLFTANGARKVNTWKDLSGIERIIGGNW